MSLTKTTFLNAESAEAFAKVRKGTPFSAFLCEKLCVLCVEMLLDDHILSFDTLSVATGSRLRHMAIEAIGVNR